MNMILKRFNALDALFPQLGIETQLEGLADAWAFPFEARSPVAISESEDDLLITVELPGVTPEELNVSYDRGLLKIAAQRSKSEEHKDHKILRREITHRDFEQSLRISDDFDVGAIDAQLVDGVLSLRLPRKPEKRPRRIDVAIG